MREEPNKLLGEVWEFIFHKMIGCNRCRAVNSLQREFILKRMEEHNQKHDKKDLCVASETCNPRDTPGNKACTRGSIRNTGNLRMQADNNLNTESEEKQ